MGSNALKALNLQVQDCLLWRYFGLIDDCELHVSSGADCAKNPCIKAAHATKMPIVRVAKYYKQVGYMN